MQRITLATEAALFDVAATRRIEAARAAALPPHTLMRRAGRAVARLAMALAPHARTVWIACGPGNNGGDGLEAAAQLAARGWMPVVTWLGEPARLPRDAADALARARAAGVGFAESPPVRHDLAIDALLGIGTTRAPQDRMADWLRHMHASPAPVLSVDLPSGLGADTGRHALADALAPHPRGTRHTLSLLTLKPGLFTAQGRDWAGEVWFDPLGDEAPAAAPIHCEPAARLPGLRPGAARAPSAHKGTQGDVAVIGGDAGMTGAALLAADAALHAGAGRVFVGLLDRAIALDTRRPGLMFRDPATLDLSAQAVVIGCGGGPAVRAALPRAIAEARALVIDADALNAVAQDPSLAQAVARRAPLAQPTVLTPHPLEAARLLGCDTAAVQSDRLGAARRLAARYRATVVLKGSGSIVASPDATPWINLSGNPLLATAGTGDVLAGMVGAALALGLDADAAALPAVQHHGQLADQWPAGRPLTAGALARG